MRGAYNLHAAYAAYNIMIRASRFGQLALQNYILAGIRVPKGLCRPCYFHASYWFLV